jgi:hypothetical protein
VGFWFEDQQLFRYKVRIIYCVYCETKVTPVHLGYHCQYLQYSLQRQVYKYEGRKNGYKTVSHCIQNWGGGGGGGAMKYVASIRGGE